MKHARQFRLPGFLLSLVLVLLPLLILQISAAAAQTKTDNPTYPFASEGVNLAAIPLSDSAMPAGYRFDSGQHYTADEIGARLTALGIPDDQASSMGVLGYYERTYIDDANNIFDIKIRSFANKSGLSAYYDAAIKNFVQPSDTAHTFGDRLPGVGSSPAATDVRSGNSEDGTPYVTYRVIFRVSTLLISIENANASSTPPDQSVANDLATQLASRAKNVVAGKPVDGVVYGLEQALIYPTGFNVEAADGYEAPETSYLTYGIQNNTALSQYRVAYEIDDSGDTNNGMFYNSMVAVYAGAGEVSALLADPTGLFDPAMTLSPLDAPAIAGADATYNTGYTYTDGSNISGYRAFAQIGEKLIIVDIANYPDPMVANGAILSLLQANVDCVGGGTCAAPEVSL